MIGGVVRRTLPRASDVAKASAAPSVDWKYLLSRPGRDDTYKQQLQQQRSEYASKLAITGKYSQAPAPIDFAAYKRKIRNKAVVDELEKKFKAVKHEEQTAAAVDHKKWEEKLLIAEILKEEAAEELKVVSDRIAQMQKYRTTPETETEDYWLLYPGLKDQIDNEIAKRQWFKDVGLPNNGDYGTPDRDYHYPGEKGYGKDDHDKH